MAYFEQTKITDADGVVINPASENSSSDTTSLLRRILNILLAPVGYDKSLQRYRQTAVIESGTVTTVSTVTNMASVGNYTAQMIVFDQNRSAWAQCIRARIT